MNKVSAEKAKSYSKKLKNRFFKVFLEQHVKFKLFCETHETAKSANEAKRNAIFAEKERRRNKTIGSRIA